MIDTRTTSGRCLFGLVVACVLAVSAVSPSLSNEALLTISKDVEPDTVNVSTCGEASVATLNLVLEFPPSAGAPIDIMLIIDCSTKC